MRYGRDPFEQQLAGYERQARSEFVFRLHAEEAEARRQFEEQLAAKRVEAERQFFGSLIGAKEEARAEFEAEWRKVEARERVRFKRQLEVAKRRLKIEFLRRYGVHPTPRAIGTLMLEQRKKFEATVKEEKAKQEETFKTELASWEKKERARFGTELEAWEREEKQEFAEDILSWKIKQKEAFAKDIQQWKTEQWEKFGTQAPSLPTPKATEPMSIVSIARYNVAVSEGQLTQPQAKALAKIETGQKLSITDIGAINTLVTEGRMTKKQAEALIKTATGKKLTMTELGQLNALMAQGIKPKEVEKAPTWKETTLSGQILSYAESIPIPEQAPEYSLFGITGTGIKGFKLEREWQSIVAHAAGFVGIFESTLAFAEMGIRSIAATITTGKPQLVPSELIKAPPTPISSLVTQVTGGEPLAEVAPEVRAPYMLGGIWGLVAETYAIGVIGKKAVSPVKAKVGTKLEKFMYEHGAVKWYPPKVGTTIEKYILEHGGRKIQLSSVFRGTRFHKWYVKATTWLAPKYQKGFPVGEVGLAELTGKLPSAADLVGTEAYWKFLQTPKTAGVFIYGKGIGYRGTKKALTVLAKYGVAGYVHEPLFFTKEMKPKELVWNPWGIKAPTISEMHQKGLLPVVTQTQLTRAGILPYIPKEIPLARKALPKIFSVGAAIPSVGSTVFGKTKPSLQVALKPKPITRLKRKIPSISDEVLGLHLQPLEAQVAKQRERQKLAPLSVQIMQLKTATTPITVQPQPPSLTALILEPPPKPPRKRKRKRKPKKKKRVTPIFGRYELLLPVATVGEVADYVMGKKK